MIAAVLRLLRRRLTALALAGLAGCTIQPALDVVPSTKVFTKRLDLPVAVTLTGPSEAVRRTTMLSSPCLTATSIEAAFATALQRALVDRLGKVFRRVDVIERSVAAHDHPLVFEIDLTSVDYRHGCPSSPETYVQVHGGFRALDAQGQEGWRSQIDSRRSTIAMTPTDRRIDEHLSLAIGALADDWVAEFSALPSVTVAAIASGGASLGPAAAPTSTGAAQRLPSSPLAIDFPQGAERPDDVAVIIGNADYARQAKDVPNARPAYVDAESVRIYATRRLGIQAGNVIFLKDATYAQMIRIFGSKDQPRGQLYDWIKPGRSRVFVYYSGHGSAAGQGGAPYLVPADADGGRIELSGLPINLLYDNLSRLPAEHVTVVLEACFSGLSPAGSVVGQASPVITEIKTPEVPANMTVISASMANQMANWEEDGNSGLFTKYFLLAMAGKADESPYGNGDGTVSLDELDAFLDATLTYYARRHYGRDQHAQIIGGR